MFTVVWLLFWSSSWINLWSEVKGSMKKRPLKLAALPWRLQGYPAVVAQLPKICRSTKIIWSLPKNGRKAWVGLNISQHKMVYFAVTLATHVPRVNESTKVQNLSVICQCCEHKICIVVLEYWEHYLEVNEHVNSAKVNELWVYIILNTIAPLHFGIA